MEQVEFENRWFPYQENFYRLAFHLMASESDAMDVVQDVYVKLWTQRDRLTDISSPKAYGLVLVRNVCLDSLRQKVKVGTLDEVVLQKTNMDNPESRLCLKERVRQVEQLIEDLPEDQRQLIVMKFYQNRDHEQIARATGLSQVNVRVKISRARKFIRKMIQKQENDEK